MPVIKEYQRQFRHNDGAPQLRLRTADDFGGTEARALGQIGQAVSAVGDAVYRVAEQQELSDLNAKLSKAQADNSIEFQNVVKNTKPGDKVAFEEFEKRADERLAEIRDGVSTPAGRNYFSGATTKMKTQLVMSSAQAQADLDGEKAVMDYSSAKNDLTAGLIADPSSLALSRELHAQGLDNLVSAGMLPAAQAEKLKLTGDQDLVKSSVRGWIKLNPAYAKQKLEAGEFDKELGGEQKLQLYSEVDQAVRAREIEQDRMRRRQQEMLAQEQLNTQNKFLRDMTEGNLSSEQILSSNLSAFGSGSKEQFLNMVKRVNDSGGRLQTQPNTFISLFERINAPDGDPNKITDESQLNDFLGSGLSYEDLNKLRAEVAGSKTEKGRVENTYRKQLFEIAKGRLTKSNSLTGIKDPDGDESLLMFQRFAYEKIDETRKAGKPLSELFNPNSSEYLGQHIQSYQRTPQEIMKAQMRQLQSTRPQTLTRTMQNPSPLNPSATSPKPARKAGESIADYLQRIKLGPSGASAEGGN